MNERRAYAALTALWLVISLVLSSIPGSGEPQAIPGLDKLQHLGFYSLLGWFLAGWLCSNGVRSARSILWIAIAAATAYAALDELHQSFVPLREASAGDVLADMAGAGIGALAMLARRRAARAGYAPRA